MPDDQPPPIVRVATLFARQGSFGSLPTRVSAPLRRMAPEQWPDRLAELMPVLVKVGLPVERMAPAEAARWALLVHVVAVLSGTGGDMAHAGGRRTGAAIQAAGFTEARLAKLLSARGEGLRDQLARLARLLAVRGAVPFDLRPLADLTSDDAARAEEARLRIAQSYYVAADRAAADVD